MFSIGFVLGLLDPWNRWDWNLAGDSRSNIIALRRSPFDGADSISRNSLNGAHTISCHSFGGAGGCPYHSTSDTPKKTTLGWRRSGGFTRRTSLWLYRCCFGDGRHRLLIEWLRLEIRDVLRSFCLGDSRTHFVLDYVDQARETEPVEGGV